MTPPTNTMRTTQLACGVLASLCVWLAPATAHAQQTDDPPATKAEKDAKPEWPDPSAKSRELVKLGLRKLDDEDKEVVAKTEQDLIALGPEIAPLLFRQFTDRKEAIHGSLSRILDGIVLPEHAPLLLPLLERKHGALRRDVTRRLARFRLPAMQKTLEQLRKDKDPEVDYYAALGLAGLGQFDHMEVVFERCRTDWHGANALAGEILTPVRGSEGVMWLKAKLDGEEEDEICALRMMRFLCPKDYAGIPASRLDSRSGAAKKEAINALRVIVDGDEPLENLSVFQAIEHAKKWKARI